ncbi:MAG: hypothetical protein ACE5GB_03685, partial [Acidimicrobiales bacterium]
MTRVDPHTPVLIGGAQLNRREPDDRDALDLMVAATEAALVDAGAAGSAHRIGLVASIAGLWSWRDPGALIADRIGAGGARTLLTTFGGQTPQALVGALAARIQAGDLDLAVVCGGETNRSRRRARREGRKLRRTEEPPAASPDEIWGDPLDMGSELERQRGVTAPATSYAVIETALMAEMGRTPAEHLTAISGLWAGFADVAASNPHAADRSRPDAAEIARPTARNRAVAWPYTKAHCANNDVDMAAALVMCSARTASDLGCPRDRWVFAHTATTASDTSSLTRRHRLHLSDAIVEAGRTALDLAGVTVDDVTHLDLYACFPAIVEMTTSALGVDESRALTLTGGLGFAGAPMNTSSLHGLCAMIDASRSDPGFALIHANGGHAAKQAFGVYATAPPASPFVAVDLPLHPGRRVRPAAPADATGEITIEAYTVVHGRDGPDRAVLACLTGDGARAWAGSDEPSLLSSL